MQASRPDPSNSEHDMACGGCRERQRIIVDAATALAAGDTAEVARQVEAFKASAAVDVQRLTTAAKSRLGLGRRR